MDTRMRKRRISAAYRYSFSRLVLHFYLYCEMIWENEDVSDKEIAIEKEFQQILTNFLQGKNKETAFEQLNRLREQIISRTELMTAFSDCFQIYEYVLNRIEKRFVTTEASDDTPEELAGEAVQAIAALEHPFERNELLRKILAQLPVRFTKQKFYSMVLERFSLYTGLSKKNIENFLYMLKSASMVRLPEHMEQEVELYECLEHLRTADYRQMDKNKFQKTVSSLEEGTRLLTAKTDFYVFVQEMVNDLFVLFLTEQESLIDAREELSFRTGTEWILNALERHDKCLLEEGEHMLSQIEGIQEEVFDLVRSGSHEEDEILDKVDRLVSGSIFMPLEEKESSDDEADRPWVEKKAEEFCKELDETFSGMQRAVIRSIMATVLSSLPIIFQDGLEVEHYIRSSLESCTDYAEREACMELLKQELMEE